MTTNLMNDFTVEFSNIPDKKYYGNRFILEAKLAVLATKLINESECSYVDLKE